MQKLTEEQQRNRQDPGAYRARSIAFRLPAIIDYLEIADKTYRQDVDDEGDELTTAAQALNAALEKARSRGRRS